MNTALTRPGHQQALANGRFRGVQFRPQIAGLAVAQLRQPSSTRRSDRQRAAEQPCPAPRNRRAPAVFQFGNLVRRATDDGESRRFLGRWPAHSGQQGASYSSLLSISSGHVLHVEDGGLLATGQHRDGDDERDGCRKTLRMAGSTVEERRHPRHRQQACKDDNGKPEH